MNWTWGISFFVLSLQFWPFSQTFSLDPPPKEYNVDGKLLPELEKELIEIVFTLSDPEGVINELEPIVMARPKQRGKSCGMLAKLLWMCNSNNLERSSISEKISDLVEGNEVRYMHYYLFL